MSVAELERWKRVARSAAGLLVCCALVAAGCSRDEGTSQPGATASSESETIPEIGLPPPPEEYSQAPATPDTGPTEKELGPLEGQDDPRMDQLFDLSSSKDPKAVDQVVALAFAEPVLSAVQVEAASTLEDLKKVNLEGAVEGCGRLLRESPFVRARLRAVEALEYLGGRRATELLLADLSDPDPNVRQAEAEALEYMVGAQDLTPVKKAYLGEPDRAVKRALWEVLENIAIEVRKQEQLAAKSGKRA